MIKGDTVYVVENYLVEERTAALLAGRVGLAVVFECHAGPARVHVTDRNGAFWEIPTTAVCIVPEGHLSNLYDQPCPACGLQLFKPHPIQTSAIREDIIKLHGPLAQAGGTERLPMANEQCNHGLPTNGPRQPRESAVNNVVARPLEGGTYSVTGTHVVTRKTSVGGEVEYNDGEFAEIQTFGIEGIDKNLLLEKVQVHREDTSYSAEEFRRRFAVGAHFEFQLTTDIRPWTVPDGWNRDAT